MSERRGIISFGIKLSIVRGNEPPEAADQRH